MLASGNGSGGSITEDWYQDELAICLMLIPYRVFCGMLFDVSLRQTRSKYQKEFKLLEIICTGILCSDLFDVGWHQTSSKYWKQFIHTARNTSHIHHRIVYALCIRPLAPSYYRWVRMMSLCSYVLLFIYVTCTTMCIHTLYTLYIIQCHVHCTYMRRRLCTYSWGHCEAACKPQCQR